MRNRYKEKYVNSTQRIFKQKGQTHSTVSISFPAASRSSGGLLGETEESSDGSSVLPSCDTTSEPPVETDTNENPSETD